MPTLLEPKTERIKSEADIRRCRKAIDWYRTMGWNPLPSRSDRKAPCCPYAEHWDTPVPHSVYQCHRTSNVQVMTGVRWGLVVVDLDGPVAVEAWRAMTLYRETPDTWEVYSDPNGGRHLWYSVPADSAPVASRFVWRLDGAEHAGIELLGDRKLIMAPPSIHPKTGARYRFAAGHGPRFQRRPAPCPAWVLAMPPVEPGADTVRTPAVKAEPYTGPRAEGRYDFKAVLQAIPDGDVVPLVKSWGLRIASVKPSLKGWWEAHSVRREDRNPSAGINERTKYYFDMTSNERMSLFDLAVALGIFGTSSEACNHLGERYRATTT